LNHDVEVQERLRSTWNDLPTHEPDLGAIRRKGSRRRAGRVFGVAIATAFVLGALVLPLWTLAGIGVPSDSPGAGPMHLRYDIQPVSERVTSVHGQRSP
jgi:hypothetical protein